MAKIKKKIKTIKVDADKCNGCRGCEIVCSAFHATPRYSSNNPARSRIQVLTNRLQDKWLPVFAGEYTPAECMGRDKYMLDGKEYDECDFCRAVCPSRDLFKEPDSGLPLKCDMCEDNPPLEKPKCVEGCINDVIDVRRKGRGSGRADGDGKSGGRIGVIDRHIWIRQGKGYRCPDVTEGLKPRKVKEED